MSLPLMDATSGGSTLLFLVTGDIFPVSSLKISGLLDIAATFEASCCLSDSATSFFISEPICSMVFVG